MTPINTKSMDISEDAAFEFERVRRTIWISTGKHPDNSETIMRLCQVFHERIEGGP